MPDSHAPGARRTHGDQTLFDQDAIERIRHEVPAGKAPMWPRRKPGCPSGTTPFITASGGPSSASTRPPTSPDLDYERDLGLPGQYPYTRGVQPTGYRGKLWTMRMFAGFGTAEETNARFKYLLAQGQTGLSIAFDLPTLYGYDTDAPEADGRVRQVRRGHLFAGRHGDPARRHPAGPGHDLA